MPNYDPNLVQTVKLTFGMRDYRAEAETVVFGNCLELMVIDTAVESVYGNLPEDRYGVKTLDMKNSEGALLQCCDEDGREEYWLKDMLIKAEIVKIAEDENC